MATRSLVCTAVPYKDVIVPGVVEYERDGYRYVYVHWDGYPEGRYPLLRLFYKDDAAVEELIMLGDMSSMDATLDKCSPYREPDSAYRTCNTLSDLTKAARDSDAEYVYVWNGKRWLVYQPGARGLMDITDKIEREWNNGAFDKTIERLGGKR